MGGLWAPDSRACQGCGAIVSDALRTAHEAFHARVERPTEETENAGA
ncbi:hypothetical protein BKA21_003320 [Cellulomonas oligotrophica]|uniref:Uncharacterized protein n=1 Tax=Cellulomonas oligotrophica TaxID=931536 RepID=A0A7Y9JZC1_9CELL|nr:hypothetical protein [Cellulomonas oligotrophica]